MTDVPSGFAGHGCMNGRGRGDVTSTHARRSPRLWHGALKTWHWYAISSEHPTFRNAGLSSQHPSLLIEQSMSNTRLMRSLLCVHYFLLVPVYSLLMIAPDWLPVKATLSTSQM